MSVFSCDVVTIQGAGKHPDADRLYITEVLGNPVIFSKESFSVGDKAVYIPVDALVDTRRPEFSFLRKKDNRDWERVKALKLRGIYSEGLLVPVPAELTNVQEGYDAKEILGVKKYEEKTDGTIFGGDQSADPGFMPSFDLEPYGKNKKHLVEGERVVVTEKIHGTNARFGFKDGELHVGSHHTFKRFDPDNLYWKTAIELDLKSKFSQLGLEGLVVYGEIFGSVQDLKYGAAPGERFFRAFAIFDSKRKVSETGWAGYEDFVRITDSLDLKRVPALYDGPYVPETVEPLRFGKTVFPGGDNIREGIVIVPAVERWNARCGRVAFKLVSEDYKLRKNGTEHH